MRPAHSSFAWRLPALAFCFLLPLPLKAATTSTRNAGSFFKIAVVDAETGRGVPLVELRTVNSICYWTDSNGLIAFQEPGLMDQEVFFYVQATATSIRKTCSIIAV